MPAKKPRRLPKSELARVEKVLLAHKQRLLRQCSFTDEVMESPEASGDLSSHRSHVADQGTENYQREMASRLKTLECQALRDIDDALRRISEGTYGICERCGERIAKARLEIVPHARLCMKCLKNAGR
ncbi:MAG: TraR/DksA C4-type zinc finger protein [candidate division WOR-3 bacterium]